jgi:3,4-dihydroxy 2-butanone 4-phosphate synthase/GTP cyclohydrolase II
MNFCEIDIALSKFKEGNPVIVVDDVSRENEGDIIFPADTATQEKINLCISKARGLVCIAIDQATANRLELEPLNSNKKDKFHTAFYEPIDGSKIHGITTGISALERSITAKLVADQQTTHNDFIKPGHLFPVVAKEHGVLVREGHTEAGVDLCKLTGHAPAAIICEIINEDGLMMRREELEAFSNHYNIPIISIQQIVDYRLLTENHIELQSTAYLPTAFGNFNVHSFKSRLHSTEHIVLEKNTNLENPPIVRVHSECITGDVLSSLRCDCRDQLEKSMETINENGHGLLIYLRGHEGRGIGISNKIAAYSLQEQGLNTYEANEKLGLPADNRNYQDAIWILKHFKYNIFDLITNNMEKLNAMMRNGLSPNRKQVESKVTEFNQKYLKDKIKIANHQIIFEL